MFSINGNILKINGHFLYTDLEYNPLNLPPFTIRVRTNDGNPPTGTYKIDSTLVPGTTDVYDVYKPNEYWWGTVQGATNIVEVLGANTKGVKMMEQVFLDCSALTSVALFDTSSVKSFYRMFDGTRIRSVPLFNTSNATKTTFMFANCTRLTSVPRFNTSNVTAMGSMFKGCTRLTTVPQMDTSKVTDMSRMFCQCTQLVTPPQMETSRVTDMSSMFDGCEQLGSVPLYDTKNVTRMDRMFYDCIRLYSIPPFDMTSLERMEYMCYNIPIRSIPALNPVAIFIMDYAFYGTACVQSGALDLYNRVKNLASFHEGTFRGCGKNTTTGSAELAQIPSDWK